jgi:hypothetical protein
MLEFEINDVRTENDFKTITFSEFKKTEVKKELFSCLKNSQLESSFYWSCEFICAGQYNDLWECIILFYSKHIHLANPKLSIYLHLKLNSFKQIYRNGYIKYELSMRNNMKIRNLFAEIIYILAESKKKHTFEEIKINKKDFDLSIVSIKMKAPNIHFGEIIFQEGDPKEIYIALNELIYHLTEEKNNLLACYWLEWLIEFDCLSKYKMVRRLYCKEAKYQLNLIWILWEMFLYLAKEKGPLIEKIMNSLLELFLLKYTTSCNKKKKYLLYMAIELLIENIYFEEEIIKDKEKMNKIIEKINTIYKEIKKNEKHPNMDFMFNTGGKNNLSQTISKLETMNAIGETFIPRI